jgi:hypothetical protein
LRERVTAPFQDLSQARPLVGTVLGAPVVFQGTLNPHSGCYFLNARQMELWTKPPYFLDRDTSFIGPLESAATLGIMRTFAVYKPAPQNASFLEVQHFATDFRGLIRQEDIGVSGPRVGTSPG